MPKDRLKILLSCLLLAACASPSQYFAETAKNQGVQETTLITRQFQHKIYVNHELSSQQRLHVYIDGDGSPYEQQDIDPTARQPLILSLIAQDAAPAILLGRPCYYGFYQSSSCSPVLWTDQRYSQAVVNSMVEALNQWLQAHTINNNVTLIGYSGGGVLAVLMAQQLPAVSNVVTVAANLDVDAWVQYHQHLPLKGSINPEQMPPLATTIKQYHFAGAQDENVPPETIKAYIEKQPSAQTNVQIFPDFNHICCWRTTWLSILKIFN